MRGGLFIMSKKNKAISNSTKLLVQVILLSILGFALISSYYRTQKTNHLINMSDSIQDTYNMTKDDLYRNYNLLQGIIYDLEQSSNFEQDRVYSILTEYASRKPKLKKMTLSDKDGNILYVLDISGRDITYSYKGLPLESSLVEIASTTPKSQIDIEMKNSVYSDQEVDILYPVYQNKELYGLFSITIDATNIFKGDNFSNILNKNEMAILNSDGSTVFKSQGFSGKNVYVDTMNIEDIAWSIQMENKEDVIGNTIKKTIVVALGLVSLLSFVIYLEWQILNRGDYIRELTRLQEEIESIAYTDSLTGLYNRHSITNKISDYIKISNKRSQCAVIFLDLDNFKNVNDVFGHDKGDELLQSISEIFKKIAIRDKRVVTSRIGGDEFIVLFKDIKLEDEIHNFCDEILTKINNISSINDSQFSISASIGVSFFPNCGVDIETLFKNSDMAMYHSKYMGKNQYSFFDEKMGERMQRKTLIESRLRTLINNNDFSSFSLVYQPQIPISKNSVVSGAEALIRWNDSELGLVSPLEFIKIAESSGTIDKIGSWVIREACKYIKVLEAKLEVEQNISVNISPKQFRIDNFVENILAIVKEENVSPSQLTLEITEQVFIDNMIDCIQILHELKAVGFKISLDDFGTGYSSLSYLSQLPIDVLKIDKSFVDNIESDIHSLSLLDGIFQLSHSINLNVIVEGVETAGQFKLLKEKNVDTIQGYYFSKPLNTEEYILFSKSQLSTK